MRTAIFLGLTAIADAINKDWMAKDTAQVGAVILLVMMCMDIVDFFRSKTNK